MENNFEKSIRNKVEQFDGLPPEKLWTDISQKLKNNPMENTSIIHNKKMWLGMAAAVAIVLAAIFWKLNKAEINEIPSLTDPPIALNVIAEGSGTTANDMFPTELELAKRQGKGIMAYVCMENCRYCEKFVKETLSQPDVHEYLVERFIQVAIDLRDKENHPFLKAHETNAAPTALFFNSSGKYLTKSRGAITTEAFMEIVEDAWYRIENGDDAITGKNILPKVKIFPNPNNGHFNFQLKATAEAPVSINIINENGQSVYQLNHDNFSGDYEGKIDLTEYSKGIYYMQILQGKNLATEKILVQ